MAEWLGLMVVGLNVGMLVALVLWTVMGVMTLKPARVCGWCQRTLAGGSLPASHGMCAACFEKEMASLP